MPDKKKPNYRLHRPEGESKKRSVERKSPSYSKDRKSTKSKDDYYDKKNRPEQEPSKKSKTVPNEDYYEKSRDYRDDNFRKSKRYEPEIYDGRKIYSKSRGKEQYSKRYPQSKKYVRPEIKEYGQSRKPVGGARGCFWYCQQQGCILDFCPQFICATECFIDTCSPEGSCPPDCTGVCMSY